MSKGKIINDPVFGFIKIPGNWLLDLIKHPYFQRLNRIKQLGLIFYIYPGAQHTRFQHSLGAYFLMGQALETLMQKGTVILDHEIEAAQAAILLHDLGHGPFSHMLEQLFIPSVCHEEITLMAMNKINSEMNGRLDEAISMFRDKYPRHFFHQLLCGQLDVDRLEYLCRDSFFTGVREGNIGSARIIAMLNVINDRLVADSKGIYSIENYLTTRRLMYWQVYLHKTAIAGELVLQSVIKRAQELARKGTDLYSTPALWHFLHTDISRNCFFNDPIHFERFMELDDSDIWTAIKQWQHHPDIILQTLAKDFINRNLFKVEILDTPIPHQRLENLRKKIAEQMDISVQEANYLIQTRTVEKEMYSNAADGITLLYPDGSLREVTTVSELINSDSAERKNARHYLFFQRWPTN